MTVTQILPDEVITLSRRALALPLTSLAADDDVLLAAMVRRSALILCPCSPRTLESVLQDGLSGLGKDSSDLAVKIEEAVENAIVSGDLLELDYGTINEENVKSTWVFAASPSFVRRKTGSAYIFGVAKEDPTPLPPSLTERVVFDRHFRRIDPLDGEDLAALLRELGLIELSERVWMKAPKEETASDHIARLSARLNAMGPSGDVPDLEILNPEAKPTYYRGRWTTMGRRSGYYLARRAQAYGAALWGFALLRDGTLQKFLDLPLKGSKLRGSDCAWHLQMAIDQQQGAPQRYRTRSSGKSVIFDFFSPLPMWAERRLAIVGSPTQRDHCLISYAVSKSDAAVEAEHLQKSLWLAPIEEQGTEL